MSQTSHSITALLSGQYGRLWIEKMNRDIGLDIPPVTWPRFCYDTPMATYCHLPSDMDGDIALKIWDQAYQTLWATFLFIPVSKKIMNKESIMYKHSLSKIQCCLQYLKSPFMHLYIWLLPYRYMNYIVVHV